MIANLRDASGKNPDEKWNHAVYMYESRMVEAPGDDEKVVEVTTVITANVDTKPPPTPDTDERKDTYIYVLEYKMDGEIDGNSPKQNWKKCTAFAPQCLGTVDKKKFVWGARHCDITKEKVDALYKP
jgi:hypothetical protein